MSNNELKMYFYKCLEDILNNKPIKNEHNILSAINSFILNNSDDNDVIEMKSELCKCINFLYDSDDLRNALNISDYYKYGKRLKLYDIAHSDKYDNFESFFIYVVTIPYGIIKDDYYNWFLSKNGFNTLTSLDKLKDDGILNMHLTTSIYNNIDQEIMYLKWALKGHFNFSDYNEFVKDQISKATYYSRYHSSNSEIDYINKKIGNIGELYWYDILRKIDGRTILASRDYGDGFGYDIYGIQNDNGTEKELLVEVKSTMNPYKNDFQLSENEYAVMMDVLSNPNANYLVATAFIDHNNFKIIRNGFIATGEDEFYSINNGEKYLLDQDSSCKIFKKKLI
ncbi:MAG: DUF3883 domain-containing protein [Bacilli bacterium]|nr:DUF3883 domain-containing protein [Bacilli bacterium]